MTASNHRIKINIASGEIEIEGSESFVDKYVNQLEDLVETVRLIKVPINTNSDDKLIQETTDSSLGSLDASPEPQYFGEWLYRFPTDKLTQSDHALIAAYYLQEFSPLDDISTSDISEILDDAGIQLANTSREVRGLSEEKKTYQTRKEGRYIRYKVSDDGIKYIQSLLQSTDES